MIALLAAVILAATAPAAPPPWEKASKADLNCLLDEAWRLDDGTSVASTILGPLLATCQTQFAELENAMTKDDPPSVIAAELIALDRVNRENGLEAIASARAAKRQKAEESASGAAYLKCLERQATLLDDGRSDANTIASAVAEECLEELRRYTTFYNASRAEGVGTLPLNGTVEIRRRVALIAVLKEQKRSSAKRSQ